MYSIRFSGLCTTLYLLSILSQNFGEQVQHVHKYPTLFIAVPVRNKAHSLPYFFSCLLEQEYPKDRIFLWFYIDHNQDLSDSIVEKWLTAYGSSYSGYNLTIKNEGLLHSDEEVSSQWSLKRFEHIINIREEALHLARKKWADYILLMDADVFLTNMLALKNLVSKEKPVVAPMLGSDGMYSNFWCGMTPNYYYKRTDDYLPILQRERIGCFEVPVVHTAILINLNLVETDYITYQPQNIEDYDGPVDDVIAFAINAQKNKIPLTICNDIEYGFVTVPLEEGDDPAYEHEQMLNVKLEAVSRSQPLHIDPIFQNDIIYPVTSKYGCDKIYMINLERREDRRNLMQISFKELGMEVERFIAVDGRDLDINNLKKWSVKLMPNYEDPFHKRPMKTGEIGCFLSHYRIWEEILEKSYKRTLIMEDDIHFSPYFKTKFSNLLKELDNFDWDLVYIGRKILLDEEVHVTRHLVKPSYSYWTLGYLLSDSGARKLLNAKPLDKMLPVDEFLPIMFDQHPNETWKSYFYERDLNAYSASPLLVHPTHYTGQRGYVSDTEDSRVLPPPPPRDDL